MRSYSEIQSETEASIKFIDETLSKFDFSRRGDWLSLYGTRHRATLLRDCLEALKATKSADEEEYEKVNRVLSDLENTLNTEISARVAIAIQRLKNKQ